MILFDEILDRFGHLVGKFDREHSTVHFKRGDSEVSAFLAVGKPMVIKTRGTRTIIIMGEDRQLRIDRR